MEVFFSMAVKGQKFKKYEGKFKIEVAESYLIKHEGGLGTVAKKYEIKKKRVEDWVKIYKTRGPEGLSVETRGRNSKGGGRPKTIKLEEMSLKEQVEYLKMENNILKKVQALLKN